MEVSHVYEIVGLEESHCKSFWAEESEEFYDSSIIRVSYVCEETDSELESGRSHCCRRTVVVEIQVEESSFLKRQSGGFYTNGLKMMLAS